MRKTSSHTDTAASTDLSVAAVLGLDSKAGADWSRLRGLQHSGLAQLSFQRVYANALLTFLMVYILGPQMSPLAILLWLAVQGAAQFNGRRVDLALADVASRGMTREELRRQMQSSVLTAVVWLIPLYAFASSAQTEQMLALLAIYALLMAGSVYLYATVPVSIIVFISVIGAGNVIYLLASGMWDAALGMILFTLAGLVGTIEVGRVYLKARLAEAAGAEKEAVVSMLLREFEENEADWLWELDTARRVRSVSPRFAFALGRSQSQAEGMPLLELIAGPGWEGGRYGAGLRDLAERLRAREHFSNLLVHVSILGEERWWELSGTPMHGEDGRFAGFRGVGSDVTEQRKSSEKIAYLARYDTLTQLPNRLQLTEALGDALRHASQWRGKCALLMVDLDRFKSVNDSLGHLTGDKLLAQVSGRLQALMGKEHICGRLGGDEFAIVMRNVTLHSEVRDLAQRVIEHLSEPYQVDQHTLYVGASVGSALGPRDGATVEELMRNADLALYQAKDAGGGEQCAFEPLLHASAEERRQLEVSLRKALGRDELMLNYQPVVDARSQAVVSFEALVRWNSADHGFVSPGKFIPLAEDTRLIVPIGQWVLRKACEEARNWPDHVKVNVNVSPEQLLEPDFHSHVVEVLAATGLRPERLEIEVTESIFLRDASVARNALEQVMALGCSVALDDFGTGYSSLGYLRKLRFSTIKVDRTFVQGAAQGSAESLAIINAVVAMAKSLDMTTTAEGVETIEEVELIRNLGCDKIQGYYFGRPMSNLDALRLFSKPSRLTA
ncbi:EAL domain-containing protein [Erythrobacter sp. T5W1-R]|uniref:putative bifunctional diguanylate cyclase/phosphodiesterase n=1 Tax=Erythrobacter sp. T5W1-R TaxID=3101752 RepID=UPI002AFEFCDE|nr:EAL domain-containing protein [Erythrobacter sp. T5W1-R]MEA1617304.1 EAL domain-containing protein [Erythrobacter sp. T5W1-R]